MKKRINGITYDTNKADCSHIFPNEDDSIEYDLCLFLDGCILLEESRSQPGNPVTNKPPKPVRKVRQLTRRQAVELCIEQLVPELLRPDFRRLLARAKKSIPRDTTRER